MAWRYLGRSDGVNSLSGDLTLSKLNVVGDAVNSVADFAAVSMLVSGGASGRIWTSADGDVWDLQTTGTTNSIAGFAVSPTLCVAVGAAGTILTSPDGTTWTPRTSGTANSLNAGCYAPDLSLYVAVGLSGTILTSPDGTTWTPQTSGVTFHLNGVVRNPVIGLLIATGATGTILTSPDGITWTPRTSGTSLNLGKVAANSAGLTITVGLSGTILTSPDGITWTPQTSGTTQHLGGVAHSPDLSAWAVCGFGNVILTSPDGVAWTLRDPGALPTIWQGIAWSQTLAEFVVGNTSGGYARAATVSSWSYSVTFQPGDLIVACIALRGTVGFTLPAEWSLVDAQLDGNASTTPSTSIGSAIMAYCVRGAADPSLTFTRTGGGTAIGALVAYRGADAAPLDSYSSLTATVNASVVTTPGLSTAEDGELLVAMAGGGNDGSFSTFFAATDPSSPSAGTTNTPLSGTWASRFSAILTNAGVDTSIGIADALKATAGDTGTIQCTCGGLTTRNAMIAASFRLASTPSNVISLPLVLHVTPAGESISLPLRLHVREAQSVSLPLALHVIDAAATGGLDGAGGWPMAPDGRWICLATLAGDDISLRLLAEVDVRCVWDGARTAQFHFKPVGALAPMGLLKQRVTLAAAQRGAAGEAINPQIIFAGVVQRVEVDWRTGIITCLCWDQFQEVLAATPQEWFAAEIGGRYFKEVSGQAEDNFDYAMARLKSVPKSIALDVMQRPVVLPWHAPARAVTVRTEDLSDAEISVRLPEASNLRTRIRVNAEYAFQVLRNRGFVTQWQRDVRWFINGPNGIGVPIKWLTKTMIEGSIADLSGWELQGDIAITHPRPGLYDTEVAIYPSGYIITPEAAQELALGWRAFLSTRWVQHRTWRYTLDVVASNLEALLGKAVPEERGFTLRAPEVSATWETDDTSKPRFGLAAGHIPYARVGDTVVNFPEAEEAPEGYTPEDFEEAARTALDIAWVELDGQAMSGEVEFALFCRPDMWLDTQVTLINEGKTVEGPVKQVRHVLNADTGDADTIVTLAVGLPGAPAPYAAPTWTLPARPNPEAVVAAAGGLPPGGVSGRSSYYIGGLASSPLFNPETMIGFITNVDDPTMAQATAEGRNWYPYQLTIGAPDILASDRDPMDLPANATFSMELPTFTLEII